MKLMQLKVDLHTTELRGYLETQFVCFLLHCHDSNVMMDKNICCCASEVVFLLFFYCGLTIKRKKLKEQLLQMFMRRVTGL